MWASAAPLSITEDQRRMLEGWRRAPSTPQGLALRASVILMAAEGIPNRTIAKTVGVSRPSVLLWRERFGR
ncbi:MAG TPA: helix-turn-helix domain-containing protein, partial [Candidatus Dormibacteraeota bacterium]|nr:helix-turn-helix domain-containing protein [Candidatus Dormibacteraeota bacterium]